MNVDGMKESATIKCFCVFMICFVSHLDGYSY